MKTHPNVAPLSSRLLRFLPIVAAGILFGRAAECRAVTLYQVTINTTAWSGQNGLLAFDLTGGDAATANNTAAIGGFATNGSLGNAAPFALADTAFFNETLRGITFGTSLSFSLQLTENHTAPGVDQFSFFLLNPITLLSLGGTTDPTGANALFAIDITGAPGGNRFIFGSSVAGASWTVAPPPAGVPDSANTFSLALLALGSLAAIRRVGRRVLLLANHANRRE